MRNLLKIIPFVLLLSNVAFAQPTAEFAMSATTGCENNDVDFTNLSNGGPISYLWDFGDGTTSTDVNPTHNYESIGSFTITLTAFDAGGLSDSYTDAFIVRPPLASFTLNPTNGCGVPRTVFFTDQSTLPDIWSWNFGDGGTSTAQNPIYSYTVPGFYEVSLTVSDTNFGCASVFVDTIRIGLVTADIGGPAFGYFGCGPLSVDFTNASTNTGFGVITDYLWDFGDGNTSTIANPSHVFDARGLYTVSLTVTNSLGCTDTDVFTNMVQVIGPSVNFGADTLFGQCENFVVNFTDSSLFSAPPVGWQWNFGDGGTSTLQNPQHTYSNYGSFDVSLTVTDLDGCSGSETFTNYITVDDTENPLLICPNDQQMPLSSNCDYALIDFTGLVTASDNCTSPLIVTQSVLAGTIITSNQLITMQSIDDNGNSGSCSFSVLLIDDTNPVITCPGNQNVNFDPSCGYTLLDYTSLAAASDNCLAPNITQSPVAGTVISGTQTVTLTATDTAGNSASCQFDVIPTDNTPPTITCPSSMTVNNDSGTCGATISYTAPVGVDNCSGSITTLIAGFASGTTFPIGTTTNAYEVIDGVGLSETCSFDVTVIDNENPTIVCPSNSSVNNETGVCGAVFSFADPSISDNCAGAVLTQTGGLSSGVLYPIGTTTNNYVVTDLAGNTETCSFDVTVVDAEPPTINCIAAIETCDSLINFNDPDINDNCSGASFLLTNGLSSGSVFPVGSTTNVYTVTDGAGNQSSCTTNGRCWIRSTDQFGLCDTIKPCLVQCCNI